MSTKRREGNAAISKIRISPQFWTSDEHEVTRGWVVSRLDRPNPPCVKKERNFKEALIHNHSQQIFSADFCSRSSQQIFSADFCSRSSQQIFSADLLSRFSSADLLSRSYDLLWSGVGGQLLSYHVGGLYCMSSLEGPFRGAFGNNHQNRSVNMDPSSHGSVDGLCHGYIW